MATTLEALNAIVLEKGTDLGVARAYEQELEDQRPIIKEMAIIRIMARDKISSSKAESIVETDLEFMEHRILQRLAVIARFKADAEYQAAKTAAVHASLITPSMTELQEKMKGLEKDLRQAKRDVDIREIATRRANGMLADRIRDVETLTERNRKFWEFVDLIQPRPDAVYHVWEKTKPRVPSVITGLPAVPSVWMAGIEVPQKAAPDQSQYTSTIATPLIDNLRTDRLLPSEKVCSDCGGSDIGEMYAHRPGCQCAPGRVG